MLRHSRPRDADCSIRGCTGIVDVTIPQYNIDIDMMKNALSPKTKAVMIAHTLGNPFDIAAVETFCDENRLWLIEDNCDALGSKVKINGKTVFTGTVGDIGTSSFYPPHHITTGEGGAIYTNNEQLMRIVNSLRDWGKDCHCPPGTDNACGKRFGGRYGELPFGYDHKYVFSHFGYNLKATEMQAAIGCEQMDKLDGFIQKRKANWDKLYNGLVDMRDVFVLPEKLANSEPSWFGVSADNQGRCTNRPKNRYRLSGV